MSAFGNPEPNGKGGEGPQTDTVATSRSSTPSSQTACSDGCSDRSVAPLSWSSRHFSCNLGSILHDPRKTKREITEFFTRTWGYDFVENASVPDCPDLPEVELRHFGKFLRRTVPHHTRFLENQKRFPDGLGRRDEPSDSLHPDSVLQMFFDPNFNLRHPDTFRKVISISKDSTQDRLGSYLDMVEGALARQISSRSKTFFGAMESHDRLQEDLRRTARTVHLLRGRMSLLNRSLTEGPLTVVRLARRRHNLFRLLEKLHLVSTVHQTQPTIQLHLANSDFVGALDLITTTQEVLLQELPGVLGFRHLSLQLAEIERAIDQMMHEEFRHSVTRELNRPLSEGTALLDQERFSALALGLVRLRRFKLLEVIREEAEVSVKAAVKQTVVEAVSSLDLSEHKETVSSLPDQMRCLEFSPWLSLLDKSVRNLAVILGRIKRLGAILVEGFQMAAGIVPSEDALEGCVVLAGTPFGRDAEMEAILAKDECAKLTSDWLDLLHVCCDLCHERLAKLVTARAKDGFLERLKSNDFVAVWRLAEQFSAESHALCGRTSSALKASLQTQLARFVNKFDSEKRAKMSLALDNERWRVADVSDDFQTLVDHIEQHGFDKPFDSAQRHKANPHVVVAGSSFLLVSATMTLLRTLVDYCQCVADMPVLAADLFARILELLKFFNSRTCQLILGAGAIQLLGLKSITAKHLALSSRSLEFVLVHFAPVRVYFSSKLPSGRENLLVRLDQQRADYENHVSELKRKLVSIMEEQLRIQLQSYEIKAPTPSLVFRVLSRDMVKFHEAIADILPSERVAEMVVRVHAAFEENLSGRLQTLRLVCDGGPQQGLVDQDVSYYVNQIRAIPSLSQAQLDVAELCRRRPSDGRAGMS